MKCQQCGLVWTPPPIECPKCGITGGSDQSSQTEATSQVNDGSKTTEQQSNKKGSGCGIVLIIILVVGGIIFWQWWISPEQLIDRVCNGRVRNIELVSNAELYNALATKFPGQHLAVYKAEVFRNDDSSFYATFCIDTEKHEIINTQLGSFF